MDAIIGGLKLRVSGGEFANRQAVQLQLGRGRRGRAELARLIIEFETLKAVGIELHLSGNQLARGMEVWPRAFGAAFQVQAAIQRIDAE